MAKPKAQQVLELAIEIFESRPDWTALHNAIFGIGGKAKELFHTEAERTKFAQSPQFAEIWRLIEQLQRAENDSSGKMNVRLPKSLHFALSREAEAEGTSLNTLIVSKLSMAMKAMVH